MDIINNEKPAFLKFTFRFSGSIVDVKEYFNTEGIDNDTIPRLSKLDKIFFLASIKNNTLVESALIGSDGEYVTIDYSSSPPISSNFRLAEFDDGKINFIDGEGESAWRFISTNLIEEPVEFLYISPNIAITEPPINGSVFPLRPTKVSITFDRAVRSAKGGNIMIYKDGDTPLLREIIPGEEYGRYTYSNDGKTISFYVLKSTFDEVDAKYFITVDDYAVRDSATSQPVLGIPRNVWTFRTSSEYDQKYAEEVHGQFRLTEEGSNYYLHLSQDEQETFGAQIRDELAEVVPVHPSRLELPEVTQKADELYYFRVKINPVKDVNNLLSTESIRVALDVLTMNGDMTLISRKNATKYMDRSFGVRIANSFILWVRFNKFNLIGFGCGLAGLAILYFGLRWVRKDATNFSFALMFLTVGAFVVDVLFSSKSANNIPFLYYPSMFFTYFFRMYYLVAGLFIVKSELQNDAFNQWYKNHKAVVIAAIMLSSADIEALSLLGGRVANRECFKAPLSKKVESRILACSALGIFLGNFPLLIIQIIYLNNSITFEVIPFFTLAFSIVTLAISAISKTLELIVLKVGDGSSHGDSNDAIQNDADQNESNHEEEDPNDPINKLYNTLRLLF